MDENPQFLRHLDRRLPGSLPGRRIFHFILIGEHRNTAALVLSGATACSPSPGDSRQAGRQRRGSFAERQLDLVLIGSDLDQIREDSGDDRKLACADSPTLPFQAVFAPVPGA